MITTNNSGGGFQRARLRLRIKTTHPLKPPHLLYMHTKRWWAAEVKWPLYSKTQSHLCYQCSPPTATKKKKKHWQKRRCLHQHSPIILRGQTRLNLFNTNESLTTDSVNDTVGTTNNTSIFSLRGIRKVQRKIFSNGFKLIVKSLKNLIIH